MCYHNYAHVSLVCFSSGLQNFSQEFTFWGFFSSFIPRYHDIKKVEFPSDMDLSFPLFFSMKIMVYFKIPGILLKKKKN